MHQRGKGRLIKPCGHGHAQNAPARKQTDWPLRQRQADQPERKHQAVEHQHTTPAEAVNRPAGQRPQQGRHHQRG